MKRRLLWDAGPGEIRAGVVEDGQLTEFRILRQRRQKALLAAGEIYTARVTGKGLVTLGGEVEAQLQPAPPLAEGALLAVEMTRAPVPEPGRWKLPIVRPSPHTAPLSEPGWHFSEEPWVLFLRRLAPELDELICDDALMARDLGEDLGDAQLPVRIDPQALTEAGFDELIESAVAGEFPLANGMLSLERTRAMTVIDVDGGGDPLALNLAAAREIPRLLRLLDVGGPVGIDFVSLPGRKARIEVDAALEQACRALGPHKRTAMNGFGFAQIVRPRTGPSIPEILCGTTPGRLSLESRAVALLRAAGRSKGHGVRRLTAAPAIVDLIRQWPEETGALRHALGAEIELVADATVPGYGHVHVSQS